MAITLNHTIVPVKDKQASAQFFADIFGLQVNRSSGFLMVAEGKWENEMAS